MTDAKVMTTAIVARDLFRSNFELARTYLQEYQFIPTMRSTSRFNRRLHRGREQFLPHRAVHASKNQTQSVLRRRGCVI
ncbi:MAG TPA: hypothetical protein VFD70_28185 [Anaerolineae bacterium]|nr:hypothetical protein [Anaerolineae bacterium]